LISNANREILLRERRQIFVVTNMSSKGLVMSKRWISLTAVLLLASAPALQAHPLDSPDIVYIDGLPCNSACQSYMAWSRQMTSASRQPASRQVAKRSTNAAARRTTASGAERLKPLVPVANQAVAIPRETPDTAIAAVQPADSSTPKSDTPLAKIPDLPAVQIAPTSSATRTIQEQVAAATALAEKTTAAASVPPVKQKPDNLASSDHAEAVQSDDAGKTASAAPSNTEDMVALLIAGPDIRSVPDLTDRNIAIEDRQSAFSTSVRTAIAAAGAAQIQLSASHVRAIDRVVSGEVPAAVLALVSREAAEWFPDIKGFKVFRIPLSPDSPKAHL
jgi:hypothetical protein